MRYLTITLETNLIYMLYRPGSIIKKSLTSSDKPNLQHTVISEMDQVESNYDDQADESSDY